MYFPIFELHGWGKRFADQPQSIYSEIPKVSVGLLTCVSSGGLSAFSEFSNDWLSPTAGRLDTYSAGSVGTRTPFSCSAGQPPDAPPSHGKHGFHSNKKAVMS